MLGLPRARSEAPEEELGLDDSPVAADAGPFGAGQVLGHKMPFVQIIGRYRGYRAPSPPPTEGGKNCLDD